jgi:hypothetical protein
VILGILVNQDGEGHALVDTEHLSDPATLQDWIRELQQLYDNLTQGDNHDYTI